TSRDSSVSGGADYPFTLTQTREYFLRSISPFAARIHLSSELDDGDQAGRRAMLAGCHRSADAREAVEVEPLSGQQWMPFEVWNHAPEDVLEATCLPLERLVTAIRSDASASEVCLNQLKHLGPISVLADREAWPHLPSSPPTLLA